MENAADALKMAFAVIVFVIAMAIALSLLSQANATATEIFHSMDTITYLEPKNSAFGEDINHRTVGLETIIPTIYRYSVENCGVTIIDKAGNLIARYDVETENVASQLKNVEQFDKDKDTSIERYKKAARIYYTHMDYLVQNLKIQGKSLFDNNEPVEVGELEYAKNTNLHTRLKELYRYTRNGEILYGAPWGTDYVANRLESDLYGKDYNIDNNLYNIEEDNNIEYGGENSLLEYLQGKSFTEYIIEVDTTYDIENYEEYFSGETMNAILDHQTSEKKLEIIYKEQ